MRDDRLVSFVGLAGIGITEVFNQLDARTGWQKVRSSFVKPLLT